MYTLPRVVTRQLDGRKWNKQAVYHDHNHYISTLYSSIQTSRKQSLLFLFLPQLGFSFCPNSFSRSLFSQRSVHNIVQTCWLCAIGITTVNKGSFKMKNSCILYLSVCLTVR